MSRFDYVQYDTEAIATQNVLKHSFVAAEKVVATLNDGRYKALALTALEEAYAWCGKAVRDEQIVRNGSAPLQEERTNI